MSQTTVLTQLNYYGCFPQLVKSDDRFYRSQSETVQKQALEAGVKKLAMVAARWQ